MSDSENSTFESDDEVYVVERILAQRFIKGVTRYLVKWQGYPDEECTWEPAKNFSTPKTLADWQQQLANNDSLDEAEVARVEARMLAFEEAQSQQQLPKPPPVVTRSSLKRPREISTPRSQPRRKQSSKSPSKQPQEGDCKEALARLRQSRQGHTKTTSSSNLTVTNAASGSHMTGATNSSVAPRQSMDVDTVSTHTRKAAAREQREVDKLATTNQGSSLPQPEKRDNAKVLGKTNNDRQDGKSRQSQVKDGQRFKNLSHQNNYMKKARQGPPPDMSKLDLRMPEDWATPAAPRKSSQVDSEDNESFLFVPENHSSVQENDVNELAETSDVQPVAGNTAVPKSIDPEPDKPPAHAAESNAEIGRAVMTSVSPRIQPSDDNSQIFAHSHTSSTPTDAHQGTTRWGRDDSYKSATKERSVNSAQPTTTHTVAATDSTIARPEVTAGSWGLQQNPLDGEETSGNRQHSSIASATTEHDNLPGSSTHMIGNSRFRRTDAAPPIVGQQVIRAVNGRTFRKGDVIVNLRFGNHDVGDVRFIYLPTWTTFRIIDLKEPHMRSIHIQFLERDVMTTTQFSECSEKLEPYLHGVGAVEPYGDTRHAIESLTNHLESNNVGALWESHIVKDRVVLVLYSTRAPGWRHLEQSPLPDSQSPLHLAVLKTSQGFSLHNFVPRMMESTQIGRPSVTSIDSRPQSLTQSRFIEFRHVSRRNSARSEPTSPDPGRSASKDLRGLAIGPASWDGPKVHDITVNPSPSDVTTSRPLSFDADFSSMVNGLDKAQTEPWVFLAFAKSHPMEAGAVTDWLARHINSRWIFSDENERDWRDFRGRMTTQPGLILFHKHSPSYLTLSLFHECLRAASPFCYALSFAHESKYGPARLFPRSTVLCLTEDTMLNYIDVALYSLRWFEENSKRKGYYWRTMLPADTASWILRRADATTHELDKRYIEILQILHRLRTEATEKLAKKRNRNDDPERFIKDMSFVDTPEDSIILSPKYLSDQASPGWENVDMSESAIGERDRRLVGYFIRWSATNVRRYRIFTVVDAKHSNKTIELACHVAFKEPWAFMEHEKKKPRT